MPKLYFAAKVINKNSSFNMEEAFQFTASPDGVIPLKLAVFNVGSMIPGTYNQMSFEPLKDSQSY